MRTDEPSPDTMSMVDDSRTAVVERDAASVLSAPLTRDAIEAVVHRCVQEVQAVDVHTHLLPHSHGGLLYGIDELLTYHYLIAELFMVLPPSDPAEEADFCYFPGSFPSYDLFFSWSKSRQAELVFEELFVKRSPLSEACRGVLTVLKSLGLGDEVRAAAQKPTQPRLQELRQWFESQDPDEYLEMVFKTAGIRYAIMTNVPFAPEEAKHWMAIEQGQPKPHVPARLKAALRVDPLLSGDWRGVSAALARCSPPYEASLHGCRKYLLDWVERMQPIYLMASTPAGFTYTPTRSNDSQSKESPIAARGRETEAALPTPAELLELLLDVAAERGLPLALKVGAVRGMNPSLRAGGDGVEVADLSFISTLCKRYPKVKFLLTVLAASNQHELCVLARKFGNLHVYGCWWFCNNPSIIETTTRMRLEMLGTAFTCQHSDARVLDQLLYKWSHSRAVISPVLAQQYVKLVDAGWDVHEDQIRQDVHRLFGGAFEDFMQK